MFQVVACCEKLGGTWTAIWLASKYDVKVVSPLLMMCFDWLNLIANAYVVTSFDVVGLYDLEKDMFSVVASLEKSSQGALVIKELFLFLKFYIPPFACANLLRHDLNFGFTTKVKAWRGASQKCNLGITFTLLRVQESVRK
jgi:hypothetical protein